MVNSNRFYTYAYLRQDRTPYYIGKGNGRRLYRKSENEIKPPKDKSRIIFLKQNLTEEEAFKHEIYMISVFGRKDLGTGILRNKTNGGEGSSGYVMSDDRKKKMSEAHKGKTLTEDHKRKIGISNRGKKRREGTGKKISEALKGKKRPKEVIQKRLKNVIGKYKGINSKSAKTHYLTFNDNTTIMIQDGIVEWCKLNNYSVSCLYDMRNGKQKYHKNIIKFRTL